MAKLTLKHYKLTVEITARTIEAAENIRDEMVGAAEDYYESTRIASAIVGELEPQGE